MAPTPTRVAPRTRMNPLLIIAAMVVLWTLFVLGVLIGMSVHREATRRRTHLLALERRELEEDRLALSARGRDHF